MKVSDRGLDLIKRFEGCHLDAYVCPAGVLTIGYGHTANVNEGDSITEDEANYFLKKDLETAEKCVNACVKGNITQGQFDALCSFVFNLGCGSLRKSTLLRQLNEGNDMSAAGEFMRWVYAGGKKLPGLVKRRTAEMELFLS
jgi:lysozyme